MSEVKVNKITPTTDCGTVTLGDSGDTVAIPAGVTLTSGGALQNSGTITNTGTITGVSITGTIDNQVNWQTGSIKTTGFTATAGEGYFCNTTSGAFTVTLPASPSAGDLVGIKDYANTADTNNITIGRNGSNIEGVANDFVINIEGGSITLIYVDATKGWLSTAAAKASDISNPQFVTATGGTITTSGDFKIHTFTGPGTFCVSNAGNPSGSNTVDYMTIAGGGSGANGGGGAGGYRSSGFGPSPLRGSALPVSVQGYPVVVGAGATGEPNLSTAGPNGNPSSFSSITSTAGGGGAFGSTAGGSGGSGGGQAGSSFGCGALGSGNTPPVSPPQGNPGGTGGGPGSGAGGGAGGTGGNGSGSSGGPGGAGVPNAITGSCTQYASGGSGGGDSGGPQAATPGGGGNGGTGCSAGGNGTANTGGGGGGTRDELGSTAGSNGGSGIVVIRYQFQ